MEETIKSPVGFGNRGTHSSIEKDLPPSQGRLVAAP